MNKRLIAVVALVVLMLGAACGSQAGSDRDSAGQSSALSLFDSSTVHEIVVSFDQSEYDAMVTAFVETGEKQWLEATVTIDGVEYERAGIRLKGNSSLAALGGLAGC